jgi:high-affinity nickel permease
MNIARQAPENMEYVCGLLEEKQAGFAASVELAVSVIRRQIERPEEDDGTDAAAWTPRARLVAMRGVIAGLHTAGFVILFAFVVPSHFKGLGVGGAVLAYTLGLRHAFDADHISAIDNCTRKVLGERQGTLNLVVLAGIGRVFASMRRGEYDEAELERQLANRGFFCPGPGCGRR